MHCGLERDITISLGDIQFWICNCFVCEFDDFLLCFVMHSCRIGWILTSSELQVISKFTRYKKGSVGLNDVKFCFFRLFSVFAAGLMLRGHEADLFQEYRLIISCQFCFLQDLSLMRCSLSIFLGLGSRVTTFINYCIVYMINLYWKEFAPLFQNARAYAE